MSNTEPMKSVEEIVEEQFQMFDGILSVKRENMGEHDLRPAEPSDIVKVLHSYTASREREVREEEQDRIITAMHERYPVPDMNMAEVWPKDEQVRWAGIGEAMVYLQEVTKK